MEKPEVAVIGNVGIDTNVYSPEGVIDFEVESHFTQDLDYLGQAGGFASRGYARLGRQTTFIGYVGDDFCGCFIREAFARDGIDMTALFIDPTGTSRSVNFMHPDGRRRNFYDGKAHMTLQPDLRVCREALAGVRLAHFNIPNWARRLLPIAREQGSTIACDLQDVVRASDPYRRDFIQAADILFFSSVNHTDPSSLIRTFLRGKSDRIVVCGLGARGCALGTREGIRFFGPISLDLPVIDTNGAGDSLAVGFLTSYILQGTSLEDAIVRGQIAARHACTLKASSSELIQPEQLDRRFTSMQAIKRPSASRSGKW